MREQKYILYTNMECLLNGGWYVYYLLTHAGLTHDTIDKNNSQ